MGNKLIVQLFCQFRANRNANHDVLSTALSAQST